MLNILVLKFLKVRECKNDIIHNILKKFMIKLRMEMGNVSKRQQPNQRAKKQLNATSVSTTQGENPAPDNILDKQSSLRTLNNVLYKLHI